MSTSKRLISGTLASWAKILIIFLAQMALVPLYLTYWNVQIYGLWVAVQALLSVMSTLDLGHQNFIGYELFKFGHDEKRELALNLWSACVIAVILGCLQLLFIIIFNVTGILPRLLDLRSVHDIELIHEAGWALFWQGLAGVICVSIGGLLSRALSPYGYFARMAWWGVLYSIITITIPAIAVIFGANLLWAGFVAGCATIIYYIPFYFEIYRLYKKENIRLIRPSFKLGINNFIKSLILSLRGLLENARQQGARLLLVPLVGASGLAAFSTMRTGANVALQGLGTITNPLLPELMRFLKNRDQPRAEAAFATVWIVLIALIAPAVVILQVFIEPFFSTWTRGRIVFDPLLFAIFSQSILVFAVAQPAMAIMEGNNLLRPQLVISAITAIIVIGGIVLLVPVIGIKGGGIVLLIAEITATKGYRNVAKKWLNDNNLSWPQQSSNIAVTSVCISAIAMALMIWQPTFKWLILPVSLFFLYWNCYRYLKALPGPAVQQIKNIVSKLPILKKYLHSNT